MIYQKMTNEAKMLENTSSKVNKEVVITDNILNSKETHHLYAFTVVKKFNWR